jgi:prephenate dehydratase
VDGVVALTLDMLINTQLNVIESNVYYKIAHHLNKREKKRNEDEDPRLLSNQRLLRQEDYLSNI